MKTLVHTALFLLLIPPLAYGQNVPLKPIPFPFPIPGTSGQTIKKRLDSGPKEAACKLLRVAHIQSLLLKTWFDGIRATPQEFIDYRAFLAAQADYVCEELPLADAQNVHSPFGKIIPRFAETVGMSVPATRLLVQESLGHYGARLLEACKLPSRAAQLIATLRMPGLGGKPSLFGAPMQSDLLGQCGGADSSGSGDGHLPSPSQSLPSGLGQTAGAALMQCVSDVMEAAGSSGCNYNPYGEVSGPTVTKRILRVVGITIAVVGWALDSSEITAAGIVLTAMSAGAEWMADDLSAEEAQKLKDEIETLKEQNRQIQENNRQFMEQLQSFNESLKNLEEAQEKENPIPGGSGGNGGQNQCGRFPLEGSDHSLGYNGSGGKPLTIVDQLEDCRCKAKTVACPTCPPSNTCKSEEERVRLECLRNPYDGLDKPREECMKYLAEDNSKTVNIEALLCSAAQCTDSSATPMITLSPARTVRCGCFHSNVTAEGGEPTKNMCLQAMCADGACVCRGNECSCTGAMPKFDPKNPPPLPPVPGSTPWFPGIDTSHSPIKP